ncbi:carbamoyltransferase C-terminal domain-containing protein [soil metagenome]
MSERDIKQSEQGRTPELPTIVESHATTWHDGGAAVLLKDGSIIALSSERVGDRYRHSWNSRLAYEYLINIYQEDPKFEVTSTENHFIDSANGLENTGHHLYHAASTFYGSGFSNSGILVIDGQGPENGKRASTTIWRGENNKLSLLESPYLAEGDFAPQSIGHFYTAIGAMAGMKELHEEGKTMGLASYGKPSKYIDFLRKYTNTNPDGSYYINPNFIIGIFGNTLGPVHYGWSSPQPEAQKIWDEFMLMRGKPIRLANEDVSQDDMDIAFAGQVILEEIVLGLAQRTKNLTDSENLCLAGGVALNSVVNGKIVQSGLFKNVFIFPASGDDGQAIGKLFNNIHTLGLPINTKSETAFYGPIYSKEQIITAIEKYQDKVETVDIKNKDFLEEIADRISSGKVIGWFQGGSELGPRALGHRSILADPRNANMREYINSQVKNREWYRPLAPVIIEEDVNAYFDTNTPSPFMLLVSNVKEDKRDLLPAITHVDGSARLQTVNQEQEPIFYGLLKQFQAKTGIPILLNTSFNRKGEPIVETPENALEAFVNMKLDLLVLGDIVLQKKS